MSNNQSSTLGSRYWLLFWIFAGLLVIQPVINYGINDEILRITMTDLLSPVIGLLATMVVFYTAWMVRGESLKFSIAWLFLGLGCLGWALGDVSWAILEVVLHQEPFPSIADFFYLIYYPLVVVGFVLMPYQKSSLNEMIKIWLDLGIVFVAAGLIYWNFLIGPTASYETEDQLTFLISLAYPVFDFVLFAALGFLLYRKQSLLSLTAKIFLAASIIIQIVFDTIYGIQSIAGTYESGTLLDYSWQFGFSVFGLAGVMQLRSRKTASVDNGASEETPLRQRINSWLSFAPYIWLLAAYALMIYADFTSLPMSYRSIAIGIGIILAMVLARQIISIYETIRLSETLKAELIERQRTQQLLQKSHEELEDRVLQRTNELRVANRQLQEDMSQRLRIENQLESSLAEKEMLLKEIHHRVKNNLQVISSILKLQFDRISDPGLKAVLQDSQNRVHSMALIHEKLYQSTSFSQIDFTEYLNSLVIFLHRSYNSSHKNIQLRVEAEPVILGIDAAVPCGIIVNELVSNSLKHAYPNANEGEIFIQLKERAGKIILSVEDNGIGISKEIDVDAISSLGLQLVNALVGQLDGNLEVNGDHGSRFIITFSSGQQN
jgi:two-component sensor histidine kinase